MSDSILESMEKTTATMREAREVAVMAGQEIERLRALNAELQKYADVGESFMEALRIGCPNYSWCDTPAEFVADKLTVIDEMEALNTQLAEALNSILTVEAMQHTLQPVGSGQAIQILWRNALAKAKVIAVQVKS